MNHESCPREEALSRRHDGELGGDSLAALESHMLVCLDCCRYEAKLRRLDDLIRTPAELAPRRAREPRFRWWRLVPLPLAAAAVAVVALVSHPSPPAGRPGFAETKIREYSVAAPEGGAYRVSVEGDAQLLSIEVNGTVANLHTDKEI